MSRILKGTVASQGKIIGKVRIIENENQFSYFQDREILVTAETKPTFLPIMKKASAIITNTGGILCHAAIISRELKIPCLVGVHRATKILHNGERVIVDANLGTVTVLKS